MFTFIILISYLFFYLLIHLYMMRLYSLKLRILLIYLIIGLSYHTKLNLLILGLYVIIVLAVNITDT